MILEQVLYELVNTGYNKKLIAGVVLTGGGAKIKDIDRFTEYILGLDARVGTPQEHLSGTITEEMKHPMHATGIGLVLKAIQDIEEEKKLHPIKEEKIEEIPQTPNDEEEEQEVIKEKENLGQKIEKFFRGLLGESKE